MTWTVTMAWTLVVPRALGPAALGVFAAAGAISSILGLILGIGSTPYVVREGASSQQQTARLVGTTLLARATLAPLFLLSVTLYIWLRHLTGTEATIFYLVAIAFVFGALQEPFTAGFQSVQRMDYLALSIAVNSSALSISGILLVLVGVHVTGLAFGSTVVGALGLFCTFRWARRLSLIIIRPSLRAFRDLLTSSSPYWLNGAIFLIYLWVDAAMLSIMAPPQAVGWYGVSTRLFNTLLFIPTIVGTAWLPRLVDSFNNRLDSYYHEARLYIDLIFRLSVPMCLGAVIGTPAVIHLMYGGAYDEAIPVIQILALCLPFTYLGMVFYNLMAATGRAHIMTRLLLISAPMNIVANILLITHFNAASHNGAIGSALSLLATEVVITGGGLLVVGRRLIDVELISRAARTLTCGAAMWLCAYLCRPLGTELALLIGLLTFIIGAILLKLVTPEERAFAKWTLSKGVSIVLSLHRRTRIKPVRPRRSYFPITTSPRIGFWKRSSRSGTPSRTARRTPKAVLRSDAPQD